MKMLVFERPFQRDLPEPCKPTNNFSRGPKVFSLKKWQLHEDLLKRMTMCKIEHACVKVLAWPSHTLTHVVQYHTPILRLIKLYLSMTHVQILCTIKIA